jgi:outer membrane protein assembly factor BamD (BamD/ComL family)
MPPRPAYLLVLVLVAAPLAAQTQPSWELRRDGRWREAGTKVQPSATQRAAEPMLERVEILLDQRKYKEAEKQGIRWLLKNRRSPSRDRGLMLVARALYGYGNRIRSFYYLDELMDTYPDSPLYGDALRMQYRIAERYLEGYKRRLFGLPILGAQEEGIEMLFRIQNRAPGSPLAEQALLRTADFYYHDGQYDFAADAYGWYLRTYPRSPEVPRVKLRQAFSSLLQFRGIRFDPTPMIDARQQLRDVAANHPELAERENVAVVLERIDRALAEKLYETGDFYRRTREPRAAAYTFRQLIDTYPDSPRAADAREKLDDLPRWALAAPPPPARDASAATTMPAQPPAR